ncbi:hypothetical protein T03_3309 [Trichinella britovi]|uniref:Uncharacterized protein n=1 Tax=Trichinella britovi TaxID=45882 RepID=A0A0V1A5B6_TRIBR|nr:hypothetical protein T03_3309 [Trichinella britovi]
MIRAIKLKRDLEITAESYHRILNEMKKRKKQLLMTMFFKKDANITLILLKIAFRLLYVYEL